MSKEKEERRQQQQRPEGSLLYSSGNWRPPGASLLPNPLNSLGRPGSAARPSWAAATRREAAPAATPGLPTGGSKVPQALLVSASRTIDEALLFRPEQVLSNAYVNSATVEELAVGRELQRQAVMFSDQPRASRPGLTAMLSYLASNAATGSGGGAPGGRGAEFTALPGVVTSGGGQPAANMSNAALYGAGGFDAIPEELSGMSLQYAADSPLRPLSATRGSRYATGPPPLIVPSGPIWGPSAAPGPTSRGQSPAHVRPASPTTGAPISSTDPWFGPSSGSIGRTASGRRRPSSPLGVGLLRPASPDRSTIEGRTTAPGGRPYIRGESPLGQWNRSRHTSASGTPAAASLQPTRPPLTMTMTAPGGPAPPSRPVSAPRSYARARPASATFTMAAGEEPRRASGSRTIERANSSNARLGPWRPFSATSYQPTTDGGSGSGGPPPRPPRPASPGPRAAVGRSMLSARPHSPEAITGGGSDVPPSPTWRPMSAVPVPLASTVAVAAAVTLAENALQPPAPYRSRHEFLQSGKRIPTGCRPLSAFSTLSTAGPSGRPVSALSSSGSPPRNTCIVPLSESVAEQPVYQQEDGPIKTSYDVVAYFSAYGQNAEKKLFYLTPRKPTNPLDVVSPFDMLVVPFEKLEPGASYWTMSALGAVTVDGGREEEGEFMALGEWMRLNTVYGLLRKMRFFRCFLLARTFRFWRATVKRTAFCRTRAAVAERLFAANPTFQRALLAAGAVAAQMSNTPVVAITTRVDRLYSLEEFLGEQEHRRTKAASPTLASLVDALHHEVVGVTGRVVSERDRMEKAIDIAALRGAEFITQIPAAPGAAVAAAMARGPGLGISGHGAAGAVSAAVLLGVAPGITTRKGSSTKSKSISTLRAEKAAILARYDAWVAAEARLPAFVRLLDYLVACTAVDMAVRGIQQILSYLENPARTRGAMLVTVSFEPRGPPCEHPTPEEALAAAGYGFVPQRAQVREGLTHVLDSLVGMLADMPRPASAKTQLAKMLHPEGALPPWSPLSACLDIHKVVTRSVPKYRQLREALLELVEVSFDKALEYVAATFEDKRPIYDYAAAWDAAVYEWNAVAATEGLAGHNKLVGVFRRDLLKLRRWQRQVEQMKMSSTAGILFVDSKRMRASLQDSIDRITEAIKCTVMSAARRAVVVGLDTLRAWSKQLEPRPADLDGYASMRELHTKLLEDHGAAFRVVEAATDMYELYRENGGRHDVKDSVALETLHETGAKVRNQLADLAGWLREQEFAMTNDLSAAVQELSTSVMLLLSDITTAALGNPDADVSDMLDAVGRLEVRLVGVEEAAARYKHYQTLFGQPLYEPGNLTHVRREFEHRKGVWVAVAEWAERSTQWMHQPCSTLDAEAITTTLEEQQRNVFKLARAARDDRVVAKLKDGMDTFRRSLPLLTDACNLALQRHHWEHILEMLGQKGRDPGLPITLSDLLDWGAMEQAEPISVIAASASKELSLRRALQRMKDDWVGVVFRMVPYKDTGTCVVGQVDDIQMQLDEQLMKIQAMNASPYVQPFKEEAATWQETLEGLEELLEGWLAVQSGWMYLEPIFSSPDIVKQMPVEGEKFAQVDMSFRLLVDEVVSAPGAIHLARDADRRAALTMASKLLEEVQRGLSRYLEAKRLAFPRFFFLSNDEMLEILSETKDPTRVQPHLRKCFEGIHRLQFGPGPSGTVTAMISVEGEKVPLKQPINTSRAKGKVEQWLIEVETGMFESVHDITGAGITAYPTPIAASPGPSLARAGSPARRCDWALRWPGMVVLLAAGVYWTRGVEAAMEAGKLKVFEQQCSADLREIVDLVRGPLSSLQRASLGCLVVLDVHGRDVVAALAAEGVAKPGEFGWQAQLRSYWQQTDGKVIPGQPQRDWTARCCMMAASLEYGYEYLGNTSRLVITPLTDRCYRTLMGAIHLNLGGAPEGPAGTGKTETVKDLARAVARQCVVFNCSDTLNHLDMAKFFKGLAATGAWACFDEFNRIDLEVLSVIAQQVLEIQRAQSARLTSFVFEGTELPLKWSAWPAITMNPGYAGRTELPDNLKSLFRSVAMMVPDYAMIAEIILYSYGYLAARPAAKKIVACYKLCSEQLSSQDHYDYGMRAVIAVLRAAGALKRQDLAAHVGEQPASAEQQETQELSLVLRALLDVNACKFLSGDVPLFNGIVADLFPGIPQPTTDYGPLATALRSACIGANLQPTPYFLLKATQLYEMVLVRHGLMLVGLPFSGKTAAYRTLAAALTAVAESGSGGAAGGADGTEAEGAQGAGPGGESNPHAKQVRTSFFVLNPKAVTMGQLYGETDPASHEWSDGVLSVLFRRCAADPSPDRKWLVLDGPVDAIWIENMNTVLDDNKKLCLNSGEIIAMSPSMNLIFEVGDLSAASPATVSRCGMVYLEPHQLGTSPLLASWLAALPPHLAAQHPPTGVAAGALGGPGLGGGAAGARSEYGSPGGVKGRLAALFEGLVAPTIRFVRREVREAAPSLDANLAVSWMRLVEALLAPVIGAPELYRKAASEGRSGAVVDGVGLIALVWSVGATAATQEGRVMVDAFLRRALAGTLGGLRTPSGHEYSLSDAPSVPLLAPGASPPDTGSLYDHTFDPMSCSWQAWEALVAARPPLPSDASYGRILVPTADTAVVGWLLDGAIQGRYPFLLVGPTGTGKSATLSRCLLDLDPATFAPPLLMGFSGGTTAGATQALLDAKVDKRRKGTYGPPGGRRGVVFVDDLNMPQREKYGAQPPIELIRQYMDHGGWYGRDNTFRNIQDVLFVSAMAPPGGGRDPVTPRLTRHFATLCLPEASRATLSVIFGTLHSWFLATRGFPQPVLGLRDAVVAACLDVYEAVSSRLLPTPAKSHYRFNLRDVSRLVQGLQAQDPGALAASAEAMAPVLAAARAGARGPEAVAAADSSPSSGNPPSDRALMEAHLRLWVHEVLRVFYDRLVDESEQSWLLEYVGQVAEARFGVALPALLPHIVASRRTEPAAGGGGLTPDCIRGCLFGDYMTEVEEGEDGEEVPRPYLEIPAPEAAVSRLEELLADYNLGGGGGGRRMQLAVFLYATEHVTRIARVLRQEGGHMLCVGVGGSGRQSLARLAAYTAGMEVFQVELSRSYGLAEWRDDLRRLTRRAGLEGHGTVFLFGDAAASACEAFVEDVASLLNSGEVPNLFPHEDRVAIQEAVRPAAAAASPPVPDSGPALWAHFLARCRANLHVVLAFSPAGEGLRERLRRYPSLLACCTVDWFHPWPDDALDAVASQLLAGVDLQPDLRPHIRDLCRTFHSQAISLTQQFTASTGRPAYVTPASLTELIRCFGTLLDSRTSKLKVQQSKYETGLDKLRFTSEQVLIMRSELQALSPVLSRTVAETEALLREIAREKETVVEPKRSAVDVEVRQADVAAAAARRIKEECGAILSEAMPALEAATQALDTIKSTDIKLVQTFKSPPAAVKLVMEAVCVLLDVKPTLLPDPNMAGRKIVDWWDASKKLLLDPQLIPRLKEYDRDNIPQRIIDKIRKEYTGDPEFTPAAAAKASSAAEGLCKWVHAMDQYDRVAKVVAPKRAALALAESEYGTLLSGLQSKQGELRALEERLAGLESRLVESQARKAKLEAEVHSCAMKLERAEALLGGLGGERDRWTAAAAGLRTQLAGITGDMLLAAAAVSYLGALTMPYRDRALVGWMAAVVAAGVRTSLGGGSGPRAGAGAGGSAFSLTAVLGDPVTIREWVIHGLPNDSFSIDSAVIAANSLRWPLCIDPQGQANRWIKSMHQTQKMKTLKLSDPDYLRTLETAVTYGLPVLLEGVGEALDPALDPLLLRQTFKQGGVIVLKLGDNNVEYSQDFRLYITTALRNPHYLPETAVKVALLNFCITPEGLTDQLLGAAVAAEMPQLEDQRQSLVVSSADNARQLAAIESRILEVLSAAQGNILEDADAVAVLQEAKRLSNDISAKQQVAERTQAALDSARRRYRPLAKTAAAVFFAVADLAAVGPMYLFGLAWFIGLFERSIHATAAEAAGGGGAAGAVGPRPNGPDLSSRLAAIERHFLYAIYCNVARSLFESHKLLLSVLLATRLAAHRGHLPPEHLTFLIQGGAGAAAVGTVAAAPLPAPPGIPERAWSEVLALAALPGGTFSSLPYHMAQRPEEWAALVEAAEPHSQSLPDPVDGPLSPFQRLLVLRCLRPDKLVSVLERWVAGELGPGFVSPPPPDLGAALDEAGGVGVPVLLLLAPGSDPWAGLLRLAEERGQAGKLQVISLGQGQGPKAEALVDAGRRLGSWVVLQNCHLAPSWMTTLERLWEGIREDNTDSGFRLWLTSMPTSTFPPTLLSAAVKITSQPPAGLRACMRRALAQQPLADHLSWELDGAPYRAKGATSMAGGREREGVQFRGKSNSGAGGKEADGMSYRPKMAVSTAGGSSVRRTSSPPQNASAGGGGEAAGSGEDKSGSGMALKRLLFGLVFLHAVVLERRRYGPIGWNVLYGFDDSDLAISARQVRQYVQDARASSLPYAALRYAIGECNYGGRVTDDRDRLLLSTLLLRIVAPDTAEAAGALLLGRAGEGVSAGGGEAEVGTGGSVKRRRVTVVVPDTDTLEGFISYVEALPDTAPPEVFGLLPNADISKDLATTRDLLDSLATAVSGGAGAEGGGAQAAAKAAAASAAASEVLSRLPPPFDLEAVAVAHPVLYHQSMNQVLVQEMSRYNRLTALVRSTLGALREAVAGRAVLSVAGEALMEALAAGQLPGEWKAHSYPSLKPLASYITDLLARLAFLSKWAECGPPPAFWMGAFFFPPAFTTAALQNFARHHGVSIDSVGFDFEVLRMPDSSFVTAPPRAGVIVHGMYLEGAAWDPVAACLIDPPPKQLHCYAPLMWFKPVKAADIRPSTSYDCPLYRTSERRGTLATTGHSTNFLMAVRLPLGTPSGAEPVAVQACIDRWVLQGTALLVALPD